MAQTKSAPRGSFLVQVLNDRNSTWQGTLSWIEKNQTIPFRSTLELIKLIDGALEGGMEEAESNENEHGEYRMKQRNNAVNKTISAK